MKHKRQKDKNEQVVTLRFGSGTLGKSNPRPSPMGFHRMFNRPRKGSFKVHEIAEDLRDAADDTGRLEFGLRSLDFNARTVFAVNETCPWTPVPNCSDAFHTKYRSNDGRCNNLNNPNFGRTETPFQRILPAAYSGNLG